MSPSYSVAANRDADRSPHSTTSGSTDTGMTSEHPDWALEKSLHGILPDIVIVSSDAVHFYVYSLVLLSASHSEFGGLLTGVQLALDSPGGQFERWDRSGLPMFLVQEIGSVFNIVLHTVHGTIEVVRPLLAALSLPNLTSVVAAINKYGIPLERSVAPSSPLYDALASHCPTTPLAVFILGASFSPASHEIAKYASQFLLSFDLSIVTDEVAILIGAVHMKRLYALQSNRKSAFKQLIVSPPSMHSPTPACDATELAQVWGLGTALLSWIASADVNNAAIEGVLHSLHGKLGCNKCRSALRRRGHQLVTDWASVEVCR